MIFILVLKDYCHVICINYSHWMKSNISYLNSKRALPKFIFCILKIQISIYSCLPIFLSLTIPIINHTYKITLTCVFLLILSFFKVFPTISMNFEQFPPHQYFTNISDIYKIQVLIYPYLLIFSSLARSMGSWKWLQINWELLTIFWVLFFFQRIWELLNHMQ